MSKNNLLDSRRVIVLILLVLTITIVYKNEQYKSLKTQANAAVSLAFHDQFYQGKACGLITTKEASELLGAPVGTSGTIIASDSPTAKSRAGNPRIDSCAHTTRASSNGYIDIISKSYDSKKIASDSYTTDTAKLYMTTTKKDSRLGDVVKYGDGAFYILTGDQVLEISAAKMMHVSEPETEKFSQQVAEKVVSKL